MKQFVRDNNSFVISHLLRTRRGTLSMYCSTVLLVKFQGETRAETFDPFLSFREMVLLVAVYPTCGWFNCSRYYSSRVVVGLLECPYYPHIHSPTKRGRLPNSSNRVVVEDHCST
jgi:hypothetical protein